MNVSKDGPAHLGLPDWRVLPAPLPDLVVTVVVPVRNEERGIAQTLRALAGQVGLDGAPLPTGLFEIIVLANNCTDASAEVARAFAAGWPGLPLHIVEVQFPEALAHVGHARACLMDHACDRLRRTAGASGVIASTDGDTCVSPDWLACTLADIAAGADAVGGRILSLSNADDPPGLRRLVRRDDLYRRWLARLESSIDPDASDPWPRHHQHFGASLAVRVSAYESVGGCPREPWLEDEALVQALREHGLRVRHSMRVRVLTSGRRQGRVRIGLSQQLREWADMACMNCAPQVPDPRHAAATWHLRAALRALWPGDRHQTASAERAAQGDTCLALRGLARQMAVAPAVVQSTWEAARSFGIFWRQVMEIQPRPPVPQVEQAQAIELLKLLVARAGCRDASGHVPGSVGQCPTTGVTFGAQRTLTQAGRPALHSTSAVSAIRQFQPGRAFSA